MIMETDTKQIPSDAIAALEQGNKIEAIKIVRLANRLGLKESKDLVEEYLRTDPGLEQRFKTKQSENNHMGKFFILFIVFGIAAYLIFTGKLF